MWTYGQISPKIFLLTNCPTKKLKSLNERVIDSLFSRQGLIKTRVRRSAHPSYEKC